MRARHTWSEPDRPGPHVTYRTCARCGLVKESHHEGRHHWTAFERAGVRLDRMPPCITTTEPPMAISIRVIDVEHTGEDEADKQSLLEVGWVTVRSTRNDLVGGAIDYVVFDQEPDAGSVLLNPGRPIPPESMGIHHIMDEDVADAPAWRDVADSIFAEQPTYYAAFGGDEAGTFAPWTGDRKWIDVRKVALRVWQDAPNHKLQTLRYWRRPEGMVRGRARPSHRAYPDAYVAAWLLRDLLEVDQVPIADMLKWSAEPALEVKCWIGSGRGLKWSEVDTGLLHWILGKGVEVPGREGGFREDIIFTVKHHLALREAEWERQRQDQYAEAPQYGPDDDNPPAPFDDDAPF